MAGFFQRLAERTLGTSPSLAQPLVPSIFANGGSIEPVAAAVPEPVVRQDTDREPGVLPDSRRTSSEVQSLLPSREPQPHAGERKQEISEAGKSPEATASKTILSPDPVSFNALVPMLAERRADVVPPQVRLEPSQRESPNEANPDLSTRIPPVVRVTIGRVEVRAELPPPKPARPARPASSSALSLSEYQRQRDGGLR